MTFDELIHPLPESTFRSYLGLRACYISGHPERFSHLLSFSDLNMVMDAIHHPSEHVRIIKDNVYLDYKAASDVVQHLATGATLIVNKIHVQLPKIRKIVNVIGLYNCANAAANMYLSQSDIGGFGVHYDTHDVYVLQVQGSKDWKIFEPTVLHPLFEMKAHDRVAPCSNPYLEVTVRAGDLLYIPRGHWHSAFAANETSIHLTVEIGRAHV